MRFLPWYLNFGLGPTRYSLRRSVPASTRGSRRPSVASGGNDSSIKGTLPANLFSPRVVQGDLFTTSDTPLT